MMMQWAGKCFIDDDDKVIELSATMSSQKCLMSAKFVDSNLSNR